MLGRRVIPLLTRHSHDVTAMTRTPEGADSVAALGAHPVIADVYDRRAVADAVAAAAPDVVVHLLSDLRDGSSEANARMRIEGTRNLVDAAESAGVPRIVAQSIAWAYEPGQGPADEGVPLDAGAGEPRFRTVEGVAALEATVRRLPEAVILRFGTLYGPETWYSPDGVVAEKVRRKELEATPGVTSFVHVDDAAQATAEALTWEPGVVNVVDDEPAAGLDWVPHFASLLGAPSPPRADDAQPFERGATNARLRSRYRWRVQHPSWRAGFRELLAAA